MPLRCHLRTTSTIPIEVPSIRPDLLRGLCRDEIARTRVQHGNVTVPLGELFHVSGSLSEDDTLEWQGDCRQVREIGSGMNSGTIRIQGDAGMHLGASMRGGSILCEGSAGDWLGCEMQGGTIDVQGNAGTCAGATYRGGQRGMTGGEILIRGNAGDETGRCMRRGLIFIGGSCGTGAGFGMIAGTIVVGGCAGRHFGAGMKRGTLIFLDPGAVQGILPTFRRSGLMAEEFIWLLRNHLRERRCFLPSASLDVAFDRHIGDSLENGRGEILIRRA